MRPGKVLATSILVALTLPVSAAWASSPKVVVADVPVSFDVKNVNGSALPCFPDELDYVVRGRLVGPERILKMGSADLATLYLHELSFGSFFWSFDAVRGYDYARELAAAGHVSVVIDRLGYDASGRPPGQDTCLGAHADMTAQIVRALRSGVYESAGIRPVAFKRIVLAGHSLGGAIAELTTTSFPDLPIAGLVLFAWADRDFTARTIQQGVQEGGDCAAGGEESEPGGSTGYAYFGRTETEFQENVFHDADPNVVSRATAMRNRDPCGDISTLVQISIVNGRRASTVGVPVLILFGENDANFQPSAAQNQANSFTGSPRVTVHRFAGAGHALTLERPAPKVRASVVAWLNESGFKPGVKVLGVTRTSDALPATGAPSLALFACACLLVSGGTLLRRIRR